MLSGFVLCVMLTEENNLLCSKVDRFGTCMPWCTQIEVESPLLSTSLRMDV